MEGADPYCLRGYSHVFAQEGAHGFELLHKPYSIEDLARVLRRMSR